MQTAVSNMRSIESGSTFHEIEGREINSGSPRVRLPVIRLTVVISIALLLLLTSAFIHAQDSGFTFDLNGNLLSQTAAVTAPPEILHQPQNRVVAPGEVTSFFVVAADTRALTYQWRFNGFPLGSSATDDALLLQNVSTNNEGEYRVVLTNPSGSVTSAPAMLFIDSDVDDLPDSWELAHFGSLTNSASTDFDGDGSSNLQEFLNGTDPASSNSVRFVLTVIPDGGSVIKVPDQPNYTNGQTVTLTVTAASNEIFHAWSGDILTRSNSVTLVMTNNKTMYARFTPMTFIWTNSASGDWNTANNWSPNLAPGTNDTVLIPGSPTVTLNTPADCADVTLGSIGSNPTLTGTGALVIHGNFTWVSGTMSGSGRTVIEAGGRMTAVNPAPVLLHTRTLENGGTTLWTGAGNINFVASSILTNRAGAIFEAQNAGSLGGGIDFGRFDNAGTFHKSANAATTTFSSGMSLNNSGTVEIQTGTLNLGFGGTHSGSFAVHAGAALVLSGGTHNAGAGSSIAGAGQLTVSGGTANLAGLVNITGSNTFSAGTANLTGNYICTSNTITISGGTANFSGTGLVSPAFVILSSGSLSGTGTLTVNNTMNWIGGDMTGNGRSVVAPDATLNISNSGMVVLSAHTLENGGTVLWTGAGNLPLLGGAVVTNHAGALFHVQGSGSFAFNGNENGRIDNAGTFRKSIQAGTTTTGGIHFNNFGIVEIQTGRLSLDNGGTHGGSFVVTAGATLGFGGTHNAGAGSSIAGAGQLAVSGGTANLAGLVNITGSNTFSAGTANLTGNYICTNNTITISGGTANFSGTGLVSPAFVILSSGSLSGTGTLTVNNTMNWIGGDMTGNGRSIVAPGATLNISNAGMVVLSVRRLENGGTVLWTGTGNLPLLGGGVITNRAGALFDVQGSRSFAFNGNENGRIDNAGTFRKSTQAGTTTTGGIGFNNFGTVDIRKGIFEADNGYTSTAASLLNCSLGGTNAGTGYGQLQVGGTVTLNGGLSVDLINGFVPTTNNTFTVASAGSRNGSFTSFSHPSNAVTMQLSNSANSAIVRVTDVFIVPQPAPLPAGLISWWRAEGNALDSTGTNHGVLTNGAAFASGQVGQTFTFDGVDDFVQVTDSASLRPASVTIEAWVKFFATNGIRIVLGKPLGNNTTFDSYGLALQDGAVLAAICDNTGFGPFLTGPANTVTGQWYHLAYTFDDTSKQQVLYVNGAPVASGTANKTIAYDTHPVLLGVDLENGVLSFYHNGLIDEASIYNRALTSDEVVTIYNAGTAGKQLAVTPALAPLLLPPELIGGDIRLTWTASSNATYRVEFNSDLARLTNWNPIPGDVTATSNTANKLEALTSSNRFYRVRVVP